MPVSAPLARRPSHTKLTPIRRVRRYTREIVQAVVAAQAEHYFYRPTEFQHYTPDSYTDEAGPDAMDTEGSKTSGDEYDDDSDDDDMAVDTDEEAPQGCDVMHVDLTEQPAPPSPMASVEPAVAANQAIVATPYAFAMAYWLPPLSSIRVPWLEPCTFLTPEGKAYMGRGTPVDRQRRAGWAAAPAPAPAASPNPSAPGYAPPPDYVFAPSLWAAPQAPRAWHDPTPPQFAGGEGAPSPTGCAWHTSFVQCLLGVGCAPSGGDGAAAPGVGVGVPSPAPGMVQAQAPVSSTLSHALG